MHWAKRKKEEKRRRKNSQTWNAGLALRRRIRQTGGIDAGRGISKGLSMIMRMERRRQVSRWVGNGGRQHGTLHGSTSAMGSPLGGYVSMRLDRKREHRASRMIKIEGAFAKGTTRYPVEHSGAEIRGACLDNHDQKGQWLGAYCTSRRARRWSSACQCQQRRE